MCTGKRVTALRCRYGMLIYLVLSVFPGLMYSGYILLLLTLEHTVTRLILVIFLAFLPYVLIAAVLSLLSKTVSIQMMPEDAVAFAIIGIAIPFVVALISAFLIFYFTLQEWSGTMAAGPASLAGMPGILSAWMGGCSSGFIILSIRYLIMRSPKNDYVNV